MSKRDSTGKRYQRRWDDQQAARSTRVPAGHDEWHDCPICYAARSTSEGLDVERLARALKQADDTQGLNGYREWAERIAREYAALRSEDEG